MLTNQKTIVPVCIPGYAATCLLHSVDRSFAVEVHSWFIVDPLDRLSPWSIVNFSDLRSPWSLVDHPRSPIIFSTLITLDILDPGILTIYIGILIIYLGILTTDLSILTIFLSILIFDLNIAQLNIQSILLDDQSSFSINQPIDHFNFLKIALPQPPPALINGIQCWC